MFRSPKAFHINLVDVLSTGRTRREPSALCHHLHTFEGCAITRSMGEDVQDLFAGKVFQANLLFRKVPYNLFFFGRGRSLRTGVYRLSELACQLLIDLSGIAAHTCSDLRRQQGRNNSILISSPDCAVETQERRTRALFSTKTEGAVEQAIHEPFEADRNLVELTAQFCCDAIVHLTAHHGLTHGRRVVPFGSVLEKVVDSDGQVMIRLKQTRLARDNSVPVMVCVTSKGNVEAILQSDEIFHGVGRGWVHADLAVPIHGHETESRIHDIVYHGKV